MVDETDLFLQEMADVVPLDNLHTHQATLVANQQFKDSDCFAARREAANIDEILVSLTIELSAITPVKPDQIIEYKHDGIQQQVFNQLKKGDYECKAVTDVAGFSLKQARQQVLADIRDCYQRGERNMMIIHGKGRHNKPFAAIVKSAVNQWLKQIDLVQAFHSAPYNMGGTGAVLVMLKKPIQAKVENSELNRKGRGTR